MDAYEPQVRALLARFPKMPATVIAERIQWPYSLTTLKDRIRAIRPEYVGVDPVDRTSYRPGEVAQCDLWFPEPRIPVAPGQERVLPVLVMTLGFSRFMLAEMIPSRQGGDILAGMWSLVSRIGRVPRTLVWDREAAIGGTGKVTAPAAAFAGTLAARILLAPPRDPEFKGMVERANGFLETSFLPGRAFASPQDFNAQLAGWLERANTRTVRATQARPAEALETERPHMLPMPPVAPAVGLHHRVRLSRDYCVRVDSNDYSVDPRAIGRFVEVKATSSEVTVHCDGALVAVHERSWGRYQLVADPRHRETAKDMRRALAAERRKAQPRRHADGHPVALRALPDYDALFGVDFDPATPIREASTT